MKRNDIAVNSRLVAVVEVSHCRVYIKTFDA